MAESTSFFKRTLKSALSIFVTKTKITKIERISESFVLIELTGTKLKESQWVPGGKVQVDVGNLTFRTYTPIAFDKSEGKLSILCYQRKTGPASDWITGAKVDDACEVFGPRDSLDFSSISGEVILFGDETSLGASKVLQNKVGKKSHLFFELTSQKGVERVLEQMRIEEPVIVERSVDGLHLQKIAQEIIALASRIHVSNIFLTGRTSSIQTVRTLLKNSGALNSKLKIRPYWADGKAGLD